MATPDLKRWPARSLLAMLMLGLCAVAQAGGVKGKAAHHGQPTLNTTLPVPEITGARVVAPDARANARGVGSVVLDEAGAAQRVAEKFPIEWRESREIVGPELVSRIRNFKRDGLPVVQLWEQGQSRVAIGINQHGLPGIYFTRHVGG